MEEDTSPSVWEQLSALGCPKAGRGSSGGSSSFGELCRKLLLCHGVSGRLSSSPGSCSLHNPPVVRQESRQLRPGLERAGQGRGAHP